MVEDSSAHGHTGHGACPASLPPQPLEPRGIRGGVLDGVLNIPMPQIVLNEVRIGALIGQRIATGMPQHVGVGVDG